MKALKRGLYAPMFPIKPTSFWNRRRVDDAAEPQYAGKLPSLNTILSLSPRERVAWGRELGRRFRDEVRIAEAEDVRVDAWQFDELVSELSGPQGRAWRQFTRGVLHGLNFGRTEFGDGPRIGFVWASRQGLSIARLTVDAELRAFWRALASATYGLVGEEPVALRLALVYELLAPAADPEHAIVASGGVGSGKDARAALVVRLLQVQAVDASANVELTPEIYTWTIETTGGCGAPITLVANADAWIEQNSPSNNKGIDSILKVNSQGPSNNLRALVRFAYPNLAPGCVVGFHVALVGI